ncbi:MAG: acyl-ACP desaturase [Acidimicrobiia bacterium]|nr:acyl-ACP desaturase [Acidimicrobiia bacterium]
MAISEHFELLEAVEPTVERLLAEHQERRSHWYYHDLIPWERGRNFKELPWDVSQCTINERARTSLVLNLLTEDNLPYYHSALERHLPEKSVWREWNGIWTAEEGQHAIAIRSYLLTSRNCDPYELEDDRMATMKVGYEPDWKHPAELFAYTSAQELATRVSHRNAGKITDDESAFELMRHIAVDENHHFMFYRGVMAAMIREAPAISLEGIYKVLSNFQMPGIGIPGFLRRSIDIARAGVYNMRIHHDRVLTPLLDQWGIGSLEGLSARAAEVQEMLMELPAQVLRKAERFEARFA